MDELKESFRVLKENRETIALPVVSDLAFLFLYGFVRSGILNKIGEYLFFIQSKLTGINDVEGLSYKLNERIIASSVWRIIILMILFFLLTYLLYIILEGFSWWYAHRISNSKVSYVNYLKRFSLVSIPLLAAFIAFSINVFIQAMREEKALNLPWIIIFIVLVYFTFIGYTGKLRHSFRKEYILPFAILALIFSMDYISRLSKLSIITLAIGLILILPGLTFFRILMVRTGEKIYKSKKHNKT